MSLASKYPHNQLLESQIYDHSLTHQNIYVNTRFDNPTDYPIQAIVTGESTQAILDHSSKYSMAIERLIVPVNSVPLFMLPNNTYSVTLVHPATAVSSQIFLTFVPETSPSPNNSIRSLPQFCSIINTALQASFTALGALPGGSPTVAPQILWDPQRTVFYLSCQLAYRSDNANRVDIYVDYNLWRRLRGFQMLVFEFGTYVNGQSALIIVNNNNVTNPTGTTTATDLIRVDQWYYSYRYCFDFDIIYLQATDFSVKPEKVLVNNALSGNVTALLTDFFVNLPSQSIFEQLSWVVYSPVEHRWIDMASDSPTNRLAFKIFYMDVYGNSYPLLLEPQDYGSCKILFRDKKYIT